ncbi:hypothetical protein LG3211_2583 [Lysobacter gummosus]|nr:hypothetical protein LG3211_2583 [Lysobacter gummosus]
MDFTGEWYGWRLRGRYLISDDGQRIPLERLRGLLFRDANELRAAGFESRRKAEANRVSKARRGFAVKVVVIDLAEMKILRNTASLQYPPVLISRIALSFLRFCSRISACVFSSNG